MPQTVLEQTLRDLARVGTLVKDRGYRQVWRFAQGGKAFYLKFYPRAGMRDRWRRAFRGSPAAREFFRLQWLQKAGIPAPRAVALLNGFILNERRGDAVILEAIEPSTPLDALLTEAELEGREVERHRSLAEQVIDIVHALGKAGLGHDDLHLGNFLVQSGKVYLIDAYAVRRGGLRQADVLHLGASVRRFATTTDLLRGWQRLGGGAEGERVKLPPENNAVSARLWRDGLKRVRGDGRHFGRVRIDGWHGVYFRRAKHPHRWSPASRLEVTEQDWREAWPLLLMQLEADSLTVLKRGPSGDVVAARVKLAGRLIEVVVKRPRRRYWYRYLTEIGRGPRPWRAWRKAWSLIVRNLPTAWPLAVFERREMGYATDAVLVTERIDGPTLWTINLGLLSAGAREMLFRRAGRILRLIDQRGLSHFDAKASNWVLRNDERLGPSPVLIDVDGVRTRRWVALGIERLLRSLREKRFYSPEDSLALCRGYAPYARLTVEGEEAPNVAEPPKATERSAKQSPVE